jgi:hypothetical protein
LRRGFTCLRSLAMDFDQLDVDTVLDDRKSAAKPKPATDPWRLGHRRPWWQWNVVTLFAALFVLVWVREFLQLTPGVNIFVCFVLFTAWVAGPLLLLEPKPRPEPPRGDNVFPSLSDDDRQCPTSASPSPGRAFLLMVTGGLIVLVFAVGGTAAGVMAIWIAILTAVAFRA